MFFILKKNNKIVLLKKVLQESPNDSSMGFLQKKLFRIFIFKNADTFLESLHK